MSGCQLLFSWLCFCALNISLTCGDHFPWCGAKMWDSVSVLVKIKITGLVKALAVLTVWLTLANIYAYFSVVRGSSLQVIRHKCFCVKVFLLDCWCTTDCCGQMVKKLWASIFIWPDYYGQQEVRLEFEQAVVVVVWLLWEVLLCSWHFVLSLGFTGLYRSGWSFFLGSTEE